MIAIGTVKILRDRVYPDGDDGGDVYVLAGTYPVLLDNGLTFWRMEGRRSTRREQVEIIPFNGEFGSNIFGGMIYPPGDYLTDEIASVDSHKFTQNEFQEFLSADPACQEGPEKRLEFAFYS